METCRDLLGMDFSHGSKNSWEEFVRATVVQWLNPTVLWFMSTGIRCRHESQLYSEFIVLYDKNLDYLRNNNGKLSGFWMSYLDIVEILLNLLRAFREGDWELHLSSIKKMIPWCFAHDNLNYAGSLLVGVCFRDVSLGRRPWSSFWSIVKRLALGFIVVPVTAPHC